jgi:ubiquinone/menaquinone biosynthesis C-methylase UbiE
MIIDSLYLKRTAEHPQIRALKARSYDAMGLGAGDRALDIGCGPGIDTLALARIVGAGGEVVGVDFDGRMISEAAALAARDGVGGRARFHECDATRLPFEDASFDACRSERVTQHLSAADGQKAIEEAIRILKPGGRIVFLDTDWASVSVHSGNAYLERQLATLCVFSWKNGFAARALPSMFRAAGLTDVGVEVFPVRLGLVDILGFVGPLSAQPAVDLPVKPEELHAWLDELGELERQGTLFATVNIVFCHAVKAARSDRAAAA